MAIGWRIAREARRLGRQAQGLTWLVRGAVQRRLYDARRATSVHRTSGDQPLRDDMAVFLIYQPKGLLESTLFTLSWLAENGISTVVVSNAPLSPEDRARLCPLAHQVIERPNVGYDFGGYREGVLTLLERGIAMRSLYVLNDSMWFPLKADCDTLDRCRASSADIFGLNVGHPSRSGSDSEHIQSFFFRFSKRLVQNPCFRTYWQTMLLIDHKHSVIRHYERKLSRFFRKKGFLIDGVIHRDDTTDHVLQMTDETDLRVVLEHQCAVSTKEAGHLRPLLDGCGPLVDVREKIADLLLRRRIFVTIETTHPQMQADIGVPYLKKRASKEMTLQRRELLRLGLDRDFLPCVRAEIAAWDSAEP